MFSWNMFSRRKTCAMEGLRRGYLIVNLRNFPRKILFKTYLSHWFYSESFLQTFKKGLHCRDIFLINKKDIWLQFYLKWIFSKIFRLFKYCLKDYYILVVSYVYFCTKIIHVGDKSATLRLYNFFTTF